MNQKPTEHHEGDNAATGANIANVPTDSVDNLPPETAHPLGIPMPDGVEYIPMPGSNMAPNGAVVRNPWSEQPEITPDNEYTPEKEDLNLLIM